MKRLRGLIFSILGFLAMIASSVSAEAPAIDKDSEWKATKETIQAIHKECAEKQAPDFGKCFVDFMARSGASPKAVAFAKSTDNTGYLGRFFKRGRVDLAYVLYPFRANENQGWLLVNGDPPMIDIDDLSNLPQHQLEQNPTYLRIKDKYPKVMLFGGDRMMERPPQMQTSMAIFGKSKRQEFDVNYRLLNGCHACEEVGWATFAFDFDAEGNFLGAKLLGVYPIDTELSP
jgi:hypothetical protein